MNYELTSNKITLENGTVLTQIRALKNIQCPPNGVQAGTLGGFVEGEHNLSQEDPCFVFYPAQVLGKHKISGVNQLGGTIRSSPEGCHGFILPKVKPPYENNGELTEQEILKIMLGDIPGEPIKDPPKKVTRFQILKKGPYDVHP